LPEYPDELWRSVADLSGLLLAEEDQETTLRRVGDLAVRSITNCDSAGVTINQGPTPVTQAATGGLVYEVDNYQYDIGEGPCLHAVLSREVTQVDDMGTEQRWPKFCSHAAERGLFSSLSLPLIVRGETLGALNLYSNRTQAFETADRQTGTMFAAQAAVAVANALTYAASVRLTGQLRAALDSRSAIDQAIGILMARDGCDADGAFDALRTRSQQENRKLRDIAADTVAATAKAAAAN